jgi:hypothetical protein
MRVGFAKLAAHLATQFSEVGQFGARKCQRSKLIHYPILQRLLSDISFCNSD